MFDVAKAPGARELALIQLIAIEIGRLNPAEIPVKIATEVTGLPRLIGTDVDLL